MKTYTITQESWWTESSITNAIAEILKTVLGMSHSQRLHSKLKFLVDLLPFTLLNFPYLTFLQGAYNKCKNNLHFFKFKIKHFSARELCKLSGI